VHSISERDLYSSLSYGNLPARPPLEGMTANSRGEARPCEMHLNRGPYQPRRSSTVRAEPARSQARYRAVGHRLDKVAVVSPGPHCAFLSPSAVSILCHCRSVNGKRTIVIAPWSTPSPQWKAPCGTRPRPATTPTSARAAARGAREPGPARAINSAYPTNCLTILTDRRARARLRARRAIPIQGHALADIASCWDSRDPHPSGISEIREARRVSQLFPNRSWILDSSATAIL
jgi:hypothetical protein